VVTAGASPRGEYEAGQAVSVWCCPGHPKIMARPGARGRKTAAMDDAEFLDHLRGEGDLFAAAAQRMPDADIASCPGWSMGDLVGHLGSIHRWVTGILASGAASREQATVHYPTPPGRDRLMAWYDQGLGALVVELERADPEALVWNWRDDLPGAARFWFRRMALETAVHRVDAEESPGPASPIGRALAAEGIDEYLSFVPVWLSRTPKAGLHGSLALVATDSALRYTLTVSPDRLEWVPTAVPSAPVVRAKTADLYLWLLHRRFLDDPAIEVVGTPDLAAAWSAVTF